MTFFEKNDLNLQRLRCLSGFTIKWIAIISMIIDHFGSIIMDGVMAPYIINGILPFSADMPFMVLYAFQIKNVCEVLGSIAFPIFCFLITEGFVHTRSPIKYGIRMVIFALISEIPFDLAHYNSFFNLKLQNVMFTLSVGIFTLTVLSLVENKYSKNTGVKIAMSGAVVIAGMGLGFSYQGRICIPRRADNCINVSAQRQSISADAGDCSARHRVAMGAARLDSNLFI